MFKLYDYATPFLQYTRLLIILAIIVMDRIRQGFKACKETAIYLVAPNLEKVNINKIVTPTILATELLWPPVPSIYLTHKQAKIRLFEQHYPCYMWAICDSLQFAHQIFYDLPPPYFSFQNFMTSSVFGTGQKKPPNSLFILALHCDVARYSEWSMTELPCPKINFHFNLNAMNGCKIWYNYRHYNAMHY